MEHMVLDINRMFSAIPEIYKMIKKEFLSSIFLWLYDKLNLSYMLGSYYNISIALSVLSCSKPLASVVDSDFVKEENDVPSSFLNNLISLFNFASLQPLKDVSGGSEQIRLDYCCDSSFFYNSEHFLPSLACFGILFLSIFVTCFCILKVCFNRFVKNRNKLTLNAVDDSVKSTGASDDSKAYNENAGGSDDMILKKQQEILTKKKFMMPLTIRNDTIGRKSLKSKFFGQALFDVFPNTLQRFFKELDKGYSDWPFSDIQSSLSSLPSLPDNIAGLTSPRLSRRVLPHNRHVRRTASFATPTATRPQFDDSSVKSWLAYESFKARMAWTYPELYLDSINICKFSGDNDNMARVLQFLHQTSPIKPGQWDLATSVMNYSLFLLENEIKSLCQITEDHLQVSRFESSGSAASGTLIGSADRFDVLMVVNLPLCSELMVLHNNFSEEIPPGHVVLGTKVNSVTKHGLNFVRKATIQNMSGLFMQTDIVVEKVESLIKKAVHRLNTEYKVQTDTLPFSIQMSQTKRLTLVLDTHLLEGYGLGLREITVRITPAIDLPVPDYLMLPPIFAVPPIKSSATVKSPSNKGAMSRLFSSPGVSDLNWILHTERLHWSILKDAENRFQLAGVKSCHRECLMLLKALFSSVSRTKLLNSGEVDPYILHTVVAFLLQESPPKAWKLDQLALRVSDAVHFLRSAFENTWLPELCVHNPHLAAQIPVLGILEQLTKGRQRNLLAHVTNQSALNVLDHISKRLQETKLSQCINSQFSSDLWEYEFFMFG